MVGRAGAIQGFAYGDIPLEGFFLKPVKNELAVTRPEAKNCGIGCWLVDGHPVDALDDSFGDSITGETGGV
jgi:hypothetical protein